MIEQSMFLLNRQKGLNFKAVWEMKVFKYTQSESGL